MVIFVERGGLEYGNESLGLGQPAEPDLHLAEPCKVTMLETKQQLLRASAEFLVASAGDHDEAVRILQDTVLDYNARIERARRAQQI